MAWDDAPPTPQELAGAQKPAWDAAPPTPQEIAKAQNPAQNFWDELKGIPKGLSTLAGKASDTFSDAMDAASGFGADPLKQDLYNAGNAVYQALPHPKSTTGGLDALTGPWTPGAIATQAYSDVRHPLTNLHDRPLGMIGDAATAIAPFMGGGAAAGADVAAGASEAAEGTGTLARLAGGTADKLNDVAVSMGRKALGNTKRFFNTPQKLDQANQAAQVALQEGVITPLASAEEMAARAKTLEQISGQGIGSFLKDQSATGAQAAQDLPVQMPGMKTGDPHALFAYNDKFGPGGADRSIYNVFGDPANPAVQKTGWGSSVPDDVLKQNAIPVTGMEQRAADMGWKPPTVDNPYLFNPQTAIAKLNELRPTDPSGQALKGGAYDAMNAKIDNAIETVQAHGDGTLPWDEANKLKGTLQDLANWKNNKDATMLDRQVAGAFRGSLDSQLEGAANASGDAEGFDQFMQNKQNFRAANNMQESLQNRISSQAGNKTFGLTDTILGAGHLAMGHPIAGIAAVAAKKAFEAYGPQTIASGAFKLADIIRSSPERLGAYATPLANAAARGDQALAATDFVLQQRDPEYRQMLDGLSSGTPD